MQSDRCSLSALWQGNAARALAAGIYQPPPTTPHPYSKITRTRIECLGYDWPQPSLSLLASLPPRLILSYAYLGLASGNITVL